MIKALRLAAAILVSILVSILVLDRLLPPDLSRFQDRSVLVTDHGGKPLRAFLSSDDMMRLPARLSDIEPTFLQMLVAYEDKRFWHHWGVDLLALARATWQAVKHGRVVSGGSTLTMQTARLLEPRPRTLLSKAIELVRAFQLEARYSKIQILEIYLTLAPYGGNIEGIEAASRHYFGDRPDRLTLTEAALLIALPQSPTRLRPDRHHDAAFAARNKVLRRVAERLDLAAASLDRLVIDPLRISSPARPFAAPHLAARLAGAGGPATVIQSTIDADLQQRLARLAGNSAAAVNDRTTTAILVVENAHRSVRAYVSGNDFFDVERQGQVDTIRGLRSPGSTLKPVIYAMAMDRALLMPETRIYDGPRQFGGYAPANFMDMYHGEMSAAEALKRSLNVPAVAVLQRLGPVLMVERLRRDGILMTFEDPQTPPGLAVALGGVGTTLEDLVRLYAALADDGKLRALTFLTGDGPADDGRQSLVDQETRETLRRILASIRPPDQFQADQRRRQTNGIAYKTGTSYGFRDAWAIGYTKTHTIGIWVGRADGTPNPGHFGAITAAPILFEAFSYLPNSDEAAAAAPRLWTSFDDLPPGLKYLDDASSEKRFVRTPPPQIIFPVAQSKLLLPRSGRPVMIEASGGERPLSWIVNGSPMKSEQWMPHVPWVPDGPGVSDIVVIDARGRSSRVSVQLIAEFQ